MTNMKLRATRTVIANPDKLGEFLPEQPKAFVVGHDTPRRRAIFD